jgi:hypothetical protein
LDASGSLSKENRGALWRQSCNHLVSDRVCWISLQINEEKRWTAGLRFENRVKCVK